MFFDECNIVLMMMGYYFVRTSKHKSNLDQRVRAQLLQHKHTYAHTHTGTQAHTDTQTQTRKHTLTQTNTQSYTHTRTHLHRQTHTHTHTHAHTHTHIHNTHTHTLVCYTNICMNLLCCISRGCLCSRRVDMTHFALDFLTYYSVFCSILL